MKVRHLFAVCVAGVVWSGLANPSLLACEECDRGHVCSVSCQSDDRGLLDRIDSALMRRQPHLPPVSLPQLPALRDAFRSGLLGNCVGRCGAGPNCGCELSPASCGCEITAPSCGVEQSVDMWPTSEPWQADSHVLSQPQVPTAQSATPTFQPRPQPAHRPSAEPKVLPLPQGMPAETVPTTDYESDPFRDDSVRVLRRVPAQSVQLRPSGRAYRQSYDPQARQGATRMSLSDHELPGQRPVPTSLSQLPRTSLDAHGSSRQGGRASASQPTNRRPLPAVVTASGVTAASPYEASASSPSRPASADTPASYGSGQAAGRLGEGASARHEVPRQPVAGFNPLRSSR